MGKHRPARWGWRGCGPAKREAQTIAGRLRLAAAGTTNAALNIRLNSPTNVDRLSVTGNSIDLNGQKLNVILGYRPSSTDEFCIVLNDGTDPIQGSFANMPSGSRVDLGTFRAWISYTNNGDGGAVGNDIKLYNFTAKDRGTMVVIH